MFLIHSKRAKMLLIIQVFKKEEEISTLQEILIQKDVIPMKVDHLLTWLFMVLEAQMNNPTRNLMLLNFDP